MRRRVFAILCVAVGLVGFSSISSFSKELYAGLGEEVYNSASNRLGERAIITACHPEEMSFTISRFSIVYHGATTSDTRVKPGDSFSVFDKDRKLRIVTFISFLEDCTGKFKIVNQ